MTWSAHLVRTTDGTRGARLHIAEGGTWSIPLNGIEEGSLTVPKRQLGEIPREWWTPWRASILITYIDSVGNEIPWLAGPIVQPPSETLDTATLQFKGLGAILERRIISARDFFGISDHLSSDAADLLAHSVVRREGMSLGTIAQDIVQNSVTRTGGALPITYRSPRETNTSLNERTYEGFNLANNIVFKRLQELSNVSGGPDIAFRPEWADDQHGRIAWGMWHGTAAQPTIAQAWTMDLDATSSRSPVAAVSIATDAAGLTNRVYQVGAGQGAGTLISGAQDVQALATGTPLLESVGSTSDTEDPGLLMEHATAQLTAGRSPITQVTVTVDGTDPRAAIGRWHVGDAARLTVDTGWLTVPAGTTEKRIISAKGDFDDGMVDIEFQDDSPVDIDSF